MSLFAGIYDKCIKYAAHPKAVWFLIVNAFAESVFWPIPPDIMLTPMCLAKPQKAFWYALLTVLSSVLGAVCGYYLGYFIYDPYIAELVRYFNYESAVEVVRNWFSNEYGILMIFVGAFTPIPYKVIAVTSGLVAMESMLSTGSVGMLTIVNFILVSLVGRGLRFFLEAGVIRFGGERMEKAIRRYIDLIGWICVAAVAIFIAYQMLK